MGECFFWYQLTQIVPDKIQRAIKQMCELCVYMCVYVCKIFSYPFKKNYITAKFLLWLLLKYICRRLFLHGAFAFNAVYCEGLTV